MSEPDPSEHPPLSLSRDERIAAVALLRLPWATAHRTRALAQRHGGLVAASAALAPPGALEQARVDVERLEREGTILLAPGDPAFPALLAAVADPPLVLFCRGSLVATDDPAVAVVGSRRATPEGRSIARTLGEGLAGLGITVLSGLAAGIDTEAHQGALAGGGRTIAVLGCGVDVVYPRANHALHARIAREGALLSELPPGERPEPRHFPERNRLLAGLARAVVVVEAAERSGSLITARCAADEGREVLAVPGSPLSPGHRGSNRLIAEGAHLLQDLEDLLDALPFASRRRLTEQRVKPDEPLSDKEDVLLQALAHDRPTPVDRLAEAAGLGEGEALACLLELELKDRVARLPGGRYVKLRGASALVASLAAPDDSPGRPVLSSERTRPTSRS